MSKERADELNQILATRDGLTGLANRRRLNDVLASEWSRANRSELSLGLIMIDIDHFKDYNDHYGHQAGDECLQNVALAIQSAAQRAGDLAARYGGEEFVLILRKSIESLNLEHVRSPAGRITASLGVAALTDDCFTDPEALLRAADAALYRAKHDGRNQVQVAPESSTSVVSGEKIIAKLVQLVWRPAYECGNAHIDGQHRELFRDVNALLNAMLSGLATEKVAALVLIFIADVEQHFQDEEAIVAATAYPGSAAHAAQHLELIGKANTLANEFRAGTLSLGELFEYLAHDVVARHMLIADRDFFPYLQPSS
jgi:diguanylate cyclase (GGDEF)-like protein/hemerythrin-like metal-binding protein